MVWDLIDVFIYLYYRCSFLTHVFPLKMCIISLLTYPDTYLWRYHFGPKVDLLALWKLFRVGRLWGARLDKGRLLFLAFNSRLVSSPTWWEFTSNSILTSYQEEVILRFIFNILTKFIHDGGGRKNMGRLHDISSWWF